MGKGRPRAVETGQNLSVSSTGALNIPSGPVYYPSEEEFRDPLEYIYKIRPEAEPYGICKIVPPKNWNPLFALNVDSFTFPTKTQAIHQLQARPASCDSKTFELEYNRFLEGHCSKKLKKRVVFEGEELDLCKLFNAVRRYGGYDKVVKDKKWGDVFRFVSSGKKISECAKHVLCQLYREHLYDYEGYYKRLNRERVKSCKRGIHEDAKSENKVKVSSSKRRRRNSDHEKVKVCKVEEEELDQICEQCRSGLHGEVMLLCDRCNKGWHIYCLPPPLKQVPPGNWYCFECLNSDKDSFGFVPGKRFTLEAFRRLADRAKKKWFGPACASRLQIEKKFWEIVEGSAGEVEVMYGSDLDTSVYGSGFPRLNDLRPESVELKAWDEYCRSPWNLNNLPKLKGSMLRAVHHNITGVMVPWLYVGMLFSAFCWHFEDHCFYSMNYLHWGEPKCWYSVPGNEASAFEKVMHDCLPDLFDAQPDLLFQLVTMLNPSILQENGVPVYSVLQEPGNFVITFPRSYHGGFNLGLNCAEAVNFAPADWLPHGGSGAELYQLYHKAAVLSHEELLCVVAKSDWDSKASAYLRKELLRIYTKERTWRERLWKSGITRSSPMSPRKSPELVGTEEDPTCVICKQPLYLSAVVCHCRPSAFVCLEHWEHLCECKSRKLRLLYRHTLAELADLVLIVDKRASEEIPQSYGLQRNISCSNEWNASKKKVKGAHVTHAQFAEQWLSHSCKILQSPFSGDAYNNLLKEAEQFLWAGSEMDSVRDVVKKLTEARKWAQGIRDCLSKIENWSPGSDFEKVPLKRVKKLLSFDPVPCNEPGYLKLKDCAEEASLLVQDIDAALSTCSMIDELELLYSRACSSRIHVKQSKKLSQKISLAKVWIDSARKVISDKCPAAVEVDILYKLKSEILELQVQVQETEMIFDLVSLAESCQDRCRSVLNGSVTLKDVEVLLQEMESFSVNIPELRLLKQYQIDVSLWITRFNDIMTNVHQREDQQNVIDELNRILKDGQSLKIQVDELPLVKIELKKACCREKALKACDTKMALDFFQQLLAEAVVLQIEREELFLSLSRELAGALQWEERAKDILALKGQMSEFEDLIRTSEALVAIMPSLGDIKAAISVAKSWLNNAKPFLESDFSESSASCSLLKLGDLKELVSQSRFLKITLEQQSVLEEVLEKCMEWKHDAYSLLQDVECLYGLTDIGDGRSNGLISKIEHLVNLLGSAIKAGSSLGLDFPEIPKLQNACSTLHWCNKVLSFCYLTPPYEDVESLMDIAEHLSIMRSSGNLLSSLIFGAKWLKNVSKVISAPVKCKACKLTDAEEMLAEYQGINISFPMMVAQLTDATCKHRLWQEQVHQFFSLELGERSWSQIMQLKEHGKASFFTCAELDMVLSEVEKVEKWKQRCMDAVANFAGDENSLLCALQKIKESLDRSLYVYEKSQGCEGVCLCMCCTNGSEDWDFLTCSTCKDRYHLQCVGYRNHAEEVYVCSYCQLLVGGSIPHNGSGFLDMHDMRNCYDSLLSAAAATANSAYEFSESLQEMGSCLREKRVLPDDEESRRILLMLGNLQFELQKLVDNYRSHILLTITNPSESLLNELRTVEDMKRQCDEKRDVYEYMVTQQKEKGRSKGGKGETFTLQQLQTARDEYDEVSTLCVFRLKSLKQGQSRSLLTQAARHHAAQVNFFRKGLKSLEAIEPHVRQVTEQQHIDYQFSGLEDDDGEGCEIAYDPNEDGELSFDYRANEKGVDVTSVSRNSMEVDEVSLSFPQTSKMENAEVNPEKSHGDVQVSSREHRVGSHSAPIFPERKLDPAERVKQMLQSSTRKSNTYVLPTPNDSKFAVSSRTTANTRPTNVAGRPRNLWHSSPLELKKHEKDSGDGQPSEFTILKSESVLKESNSSNTSTQLPPPLTEGPVPTQLGSSSEGKKIKRKAVSGPLTSKQLSTKPVLSASSPIASAELPHLASAVFSHLPIPQPLSPPKVSPSASPPLVSSPRINELHELPRPPGSSAAKPAKSPALVGHSAPLVSRNQELSTSNIPSLVSSGASPLPTPPLIVPRSFSIPSSNQRAMAIHVSRLLEAPQVPDKDGEVASPPLTPISLVNIKLIPGVSEVASHSGQIRGGS